jgi:hypothetical protein
MRECPQLKGKSHTEREAMVAQARDNTPCWNCGFVGHSKPDCPTPAPPGHGRLVISRRNPPTTDMNVSEILTAQTDKYERYCALLAQYLEMSSGQEETSMICQPIIMNGATTTRSSTEREPVASSGEQQEQELPLAKKLKSTRNFGSFQARVIESGLTTLGNATHQQEGNWNSRRKSIFIVAER